MQSSSLGLTVYLPIPIPVAGQRQEAATGQQSSQCIWPRYKLDHIQVVINYTQRQDTLHKGTVSLKYRGHATLTIIYKQFLQIEIKVKNYITISLNIENDVNTRNIYTENTNGYLMRLYALLAEAGEGVAQWSL